MERVGIKSSKIHFRGIMAKEENVIKDKDNANTFLSALTQSMPTSPNSFRCNNMMENVVSSARDPTIDLLRLPVFPKLEKCISEPDMCNKTCPSEDEEKEKNDISHPGSKSDGHISSIASQLAVQNEGENIKYSAEDITSEGKMLSESRTTPQPPVISLRHGTAPPCPTEALIMPRKLPNPCVESQDRQKLHRELLFNQKIGKNVLNQKSELQRAMEKHKDTQIRKELEMQKQETRTPFEKVIEERARRLENIEKNNCVSEENNKPEFLQVHAKLRARMNSK